MGNTMSRTTSQNVPLPLGLRLVTMWDRGNGRSISPQSCHIIYGTYTI